MGLLSLGTPMPWDEAKKYADHVRTHGIIQFLNLWEATKDSQKDCLLWGDEIEYIVVSLDEENQRAKLSLRVWEILQHLAIQEEEAMTDPAKRLLVDSSWHPEYGRYMLEGTPGEPYMGLPRDLLAVERNMKLRRELARSLMKPNEVPVTLTSYPRLGCAGEFLEPHHEPHGPAARSLFVPDDIINAHARFPTLTANIRRRRGSKVAINMPIFHDVNTPKPFIDPTIPTFNDYPEDKNAIEEGAAKPDHIYMDAMAFGMGCCCLQITFQAVNVDEARKIYDQMAPLGPIMLALTAAAPIYRGYLSDVDCRWNVIAQSVDDRTEEERGLKPLKENKYRIPKSRYDSIDSYISNDPSYKPEYNDIPLVYDEDIYKKLSDNGIDDLLARHISHLFIRDPLVIFHELLNVDDNESTDHFENLQSTNWQTMRFKPPPSKTSPIGWRVEFRSMEIQLTDFENAAFAIFIVLVTRAVLSFNTNFYIPISKVDENMKVAHHRNAVLQEKFHFRKQIFPQSRPSTPASGTPSGSPPHTDNSNSSHHHHHQQQPSAGVDNEYELMTIDEIINGNPAKGFPGLLGLVNNYLNTLNIDIETRCEISKYLELIKKRANGTLMTAASWIRQFVQNHPDYKKDSVVSEKINFDLIKTLEKINKGEVQVPELLG
ncbi:glutamate-cysteine ligase-domain-containing protein, partial [Lobosporangium transversale]